MQIVIFDTEFTAWEGSKERKWSLSWEHREIIQVAAVKVDVSPSGVEILSSINILVKPSINPNLSDYVVALTGIEQQVLDDMGVDFPAALEQLHLFCEQGTLPCYSWGNDNHVLAENCLLNRMDMLAFSAGFFNLHSMVRKVKLDGSHLCSGELANHLGLNLHGHLHNALYDVRSIALALNHWVSNGQLSEKNFQTQIRLH